MNKWHTVGLVWIDNGSDDFTAICQKVAQKIHTKGKSLTSHESWKMPRHRQKEMWEASAGHSWGISAGHSKCIASSH